MVRKKVGSQLKLKKYKHISPFGREAFKKWSSFSFEVLDFKIINNVTTIIKVLEISRKCKVKRLQFLTVITP